MHKTASEQAASAYERASLFARVTYTWVGPLIDKAQRPKPADSTKDLDGQPDPDLLQEQDADGLSPAEFSANALAAALAGSARSKRLLNSLAVLHARRLGIHAALVLGVLAMRQELGAPPNFARCTRGMRGLSLCLHCGS
jgi:hypothetical protein